MGKMSYLKQVRRTGSLFGVNLEGLGQVVSKDSGQILRIGDGRRAVGGDEVQGFERVLVEIWGFTLDHL